MVQDFFFEDITDQPNNGSNGSFNEPTFISSSIFSSFYTEILEEHSLDQDEAKQPGHMDDVFQGYTYSGLNHTSKEFESLNDSYNKNIEENLPSNSSQYHNQRFKSRAADEPLIDFNTSPQSFSKDHLPNETGHENNTEDKFDFDEYFFQTNSVDQNQANNLFSTTCNTKNMSSDFLIQFCQLEPRGTCQKFTITKFYQNSVYRPWFCESHSDLYQDNKKESNPEPSISNNKSDEPPAHYSKTSFLVNKDKEPFGQNLKTEEELPSTSLNSSSFVSVTDSPPSSLKPKESDFVSLFSMGNSSNSKWNFISDQTLKSSTKSRAKKSSKVSVKANFPKKNETNNDNNYNQMTKTPAELNNELATLNNIRMSIPKHIWDDKKLGLIYIYSVKTPIDAKVPIKQYYKIGNQMNIKNIYSDELCKCPIVNGIKGQGSFVQFSFLGGGIRVNHLKLCIYLLHEEVKKFLFLPAPFKNDNCSYCGGSHNEWFYLNENCISYLERNHGCSRNNPNFGWTYISSTLRQIKSVTDNL